jgi:hypothetical protein
MVHQHRMGMPPDEFGGPGRKLTALRPVRPAREPFFIRKYGGAAG